MTLIMGVFGVAFILLTFGYIAWEQRNRLIQRNEDDIRSNAFFLADHAARLIEVSDLTLKQAAILIEGDGWNKVQQSRDLWQHLRTLEEALPSVSGIWLTDAAGKLRLTSRVFPAPEVDSSDSEVFRIHAKSDDGLFISKPLIGRVTNEPTFTISRRIEGRSDRFEGVAAVTVTQSYFNAYWEKLRLPKGSRISLVRAEDAQVIAQYPSPADGLSFRPIDKEAFERARAANPQSGAYTFAGASGERMDAYQRVGEMPLYMNISMPQDAYWVPWTIQMKLYGAFALIALLALMALTALATQQFREQAADEARLQREVALRTGELKAETAALEILHRTGRALAAELHIDRVIENVVEAAVLLTGAQIGVFLSQGEEEGEGWIARYGHYAVEGAKEAFSGLSLQAICSTPFEEGETIRADDVTTHPAYSPMLPGESASSGALRIHSLMAVPVLSRTGAVQGVLLFAHARTGAFTERAERLVTGLAAQAAIALENGRLYQEAQHEIEERKQAQSQQSFLIRELHHRVKNTLATVQAVVGATARATSNIDDFYKAFVGRIISLANTHSLLTEAVWQTAPLREILEKELKPYNDARGERIAINGPRVELPSEIAVPIGMAVHELTTNAAKYGALSESAGRVSVSWDVQGEAEEARLVITWEERGGPPVSKPQRQGFGSRLLHRVLTTQLNAKVDVDYDRAGLRVGIDAPLHSTGSLRTPI